MIVEKPHVLGGKTCLSSILSTKKSHKKLSGMEPEPPR